MNIYIVLGSGNSGAGAIHDYLSSREDCIAPFKGAEFRIVNDPNGIDDLYNNLYENFSINKSSNSIYEFRKFIRTIYYSNYNKKFKIYKKEIIKLSNDFIKSIAKTNYNGSPQFFFDNLNFYQKLKFYFFRFILRKNARNIDLLNMITPVSSDEFLQEANGFLLNIIKFNPNFDGKKNVVIEQGGNYWKPITSTKYYGANRKIILVNRNPKAIFWSMKRRNSLSYPSHDVEIFVKWYKNIMKFVNSEEHSKVIKIDFENFFSNFQSESTKLCEKLNLEKKVQHNFDLDHTLKNLYKYKDNLSQYEIDYIDKNLKS